MDSILQFSKKLAFPLSQSTDSLASLAESIETDISEPNSDNLKKYKRISNVVRNQLLQKIFFQNKRIKQAAHELNINYSSAKTILHLFRKKFRKEFQQSDAINMCKFRSLQINEKSTCQLQVTQGGRFYDTVSKNKKSKKIKKNKRQNLNQQSKQHEEQQLHQQQIYQQQQQTLNFMNQQSLIQQLLSLLPQQQTILQDEEEFIFSSKKQPKLNNIIRRNIIITNVDKDIFDHEINCSK